MIRKGNKKDLKIIVENNIKMAKETENIELNREIVKKGVLAVLTDSKKGEYYIYEENDIILGQLMITKEWSDWRDGYFWWIQSVYVHPKYRREGIFNNLYKHLKEQVNHNTNICGLRLYVDENNIRAQKTYEKMKMENSNYLMYEWEK